MLDLNYVRENLESVRAALAKRGMAPTPLDDFAQADAERRRLIAESDQLNAERNTATYVLDTSAVLALIENEAGAERVEEILRTQRVLLPFLVSLEIYYLTL